MVPPSEYICIAAGILVFNSKLDIYFVLFGATIFNLLGTYSWYLLGKRHINSHKTISRNTLASDSRNLWHKVHYMYTHQLENIEGLFRSHGIIILFFLRNVPVLRSIISYPAGRVGMPVSHFLIVSFFGIFLWVSIWTFLGYFLGNVALRYKGPIAISVGIIAFIAIKVALSFLNRRVMKNGKQLSRDL